MFGKDATDNQILEFSLFSGTGSHSNTIINMFKFRRFIVTPFITGGKSIQVCLNRQLKTKEAENFLILKIKFV